VIVFQRLTREEIAEIVEIQLRNLARTVADRGITLAWTEEAKKTIADRGYDPTYGARPLKRLIQKEVMDGLARKILMNEIAAGDTAEVTASPGGGPVEIRKVTSKQKVAV
jgi:ATP-dependent Clp protease ATP-binding subunit ClpB